MLELSIPIIRVVNAEAAEHFYCQLLGFQKQFDYRAVKDQQALRYLGLKRDNAWLHVSTFPDDGVSGITIYLRVYSVDAIFKELQEKRVAVESEPVNQPWGTREMVVRDPDGNRLRYAQER